MTEPANVDTLEPPAPWDGMHGSGTVRAEPWLDLQDDDQAVRRQLVLLMRYLLTASLVGNPAPNTARVYQRISSPRVGDLVVESSRTLYQVTGPRFDPNSTWYRGVGYLLAKRREKIGEDDEAVYDTAWYVQYGPEPGDICRWEDSAFLAIPSGWPDDID